MQYEPIHVKPAEDLVVGIQGLNLSLNNIHIIKHVEIKSRDYDNNCS